MRSEKKAWQLIKNRKCHEAVTLHVLIKCYFILQQACVYVHEYDCSAALPARKLVRPCSPRDRRVWVGSRNNLIGLSALPFSCSPILQHKWAYGHTHTHKHRDLCSGFTPKVLHVILALHLVYRTHLSGVKMNVNICAIWTPSPPAFSMESLKSKENTHHSSIQDLDVSRCSKYGLLVRRRHSIPSYQILSSDMLIFRDSNRWNELWLVASINNWLSEMQADTVTFAFNLLQQQSDLHAMANIVTLQSGKTGSSWKHSTA